MNVNYMIPGIITIPESEELWTEPHCQTGLAG